MSQRLELPPEGSSAQPIRHVAVIEVAEPSDPPAIPSPTSLRPRETGRVFVALRPLITGLILILFALLVARGIEIRISDITIYLGR
jgi:hypothetical protein